MKKKKITSKLKISKKVVAQLTEDQANSIQAGKATNGNKDTVATHCCPSILSVTCPPTNK